MYSIHKNVNPTIRANDETLIYGIKKHVFTRVSFKYNRGDCSGRDSRWNTADARKWSTFMGVGNKTSQYDWTNEFYLFEYFSTSSRWPEFNCFFQSGFFNVGVVVISGVQVVGWIHYSRISLHPYSITRPQDAGNRFVSLYLGMNNQVLYFFKNNKLSFFRGATQSPFRIHLVWRRTYVSIGDSYKVSRNHGLEIF